jgi:hypothetical protein
MLFELLAEGAGTIFAADGRLEPVDAAGRGIGWNDMVLEPL